MSATAALPPPRPRHPSDQAVLKGLKWSLAGHALLVAAVIVKSLVFPDKPIAYIPTLRVDIVGLPDVLKKDLSKPKTPGAIEIEKALKRAEEQAKKIKAPPAPKEEVADPKEMVLKPKSKDSAKEREEKLKNALNRIKALEKIRAEVVKPQAAPLIKGNRISKGTSISGDARESEAANYLDSVRDRLQENWALPIWLSRQNLSAQVMLRIDLRGRIRDYRFIKTSGNEQFDEAVKRCLKASEPFPVPSEEAASSVMVDGVLVGFPL